MRGAANPNPSTYQEGTLVSFVSPGVVTGYTFAGWTPAQITAEMTGSQTIQASWTANRYSIVYNPNGGSGEMDATACVYDSEATIAANGFTWAGHVFAGWADKSDGAVVYASGQAVTNLTAQSNGVVTLYATWEPLVVAVPTVTPADGAVFTGESCEVTLSCAIDGAVIYYSAKGATPRLTDAYKYKGPFTISDTATIKAIAVKEGMKSEYMTATITKRTLTLADALGLGSADATVTTGGDAAWTPVADATTESGYSCRSGEIGDGEDTWLKVEVNGKGTISFRARVSCEHDDAGDFSWDSLRIAVDGEERIGWRMDGDSGWERARTVEFTTAGSHTIRWTYHKDEEPETWDGEDCAWICGVVWSPVESGDITVDTGDGKTVTVSSSWLAENTTRAPTDDAANGLPVWECYVLGLDPEDSDDDFRITKFWMDGAIPMFEVNHTKDGDGNSFVPRIRKLGKAKLTDKWSPVPEGGEDSFRFFTVEVTLE